MKNEVTVMQTGEDVMDSDTKKTVLALLGIPVLLVLALVAMMPLDLFRAWIVQKLYIWFLLPLHAPHLNLWHVWGIALLIDVVKFSNFQNTTKEKGAAEWIGRLLGTIIYPLLILLVAYFIKGHIGY